MSTVAARADRVGRAGTPALVAGPHGLHRGRAPAWWGMALLIVTEGMFFSILLTTYWFLRFQHGPQWPPGEIGKPDLLLVSIMTPILLLSSVPMHWAETGIKRGRRWQMNLGLAATFLMGATFLGLQGVEYAEKLREFTPQAGVYGTLFYSITGFHGIHVLVGLLLNLWLQYYGWRGFFTRDRHLPVENVAMYWHFVDAVWVAILLTIYVSPHVWS